MASRTRRPPPRKPFDRLAYCKFCGAQATNYASLLIYDCGSSLDTQAGIHLSPDAWKRSPACFSMEKAKSR